MAPRPTTLAELASERGYFGRVAEVALRIPRATDGAEAASLLRQAAQALGGNVAAFASIMKDDESCESYRFVLACDPTWCLEYEGLACYMHDPWIEYVKHHTQPAVASQIQARTPREQAVADLATRFGFRSAIVVPSPAPRGLTRVGALCIGSDTEHWFSGPGLDAALLAARSVAMPLHDWLVARLREELIGQASLTAEDLVLLEHERQGHKSKHVAQALQVSSLAVDSRWQRLNAKLGVTSRARAAHLAAEFGLI